LEAGCIPVIIDRFKNFNYKWIFEPWKEQLLRVKWRDGETALPFIWVKSPEDFMEFYDRFFMRPGGRAKLDAMQRDTLEWWHSAKAHFKALHEEAICPLSV
jgi:hypothetical protein